MLELGEQQPVSWCDTFRQTTSRSRVRRRVSVPIPVMSAAVLTAFAPQIPFKTDGKRCVHVQFTEESYGR